jgi:hypothetical protein
MNIDKIKELKSCIGESVSENFSPTLRAKLLAIDESRGGGVCIMEVVPSPYPEWSWSAQQNHTAGHRYERPIYAIHNAFFF